MNGHGRARKPAWAARQPLVFISHDSRDADLAEAFGELLERVCSGTVRCFRSSDKAGDQGISYGDEWYESLMGSLTSATDVVCLLTGRSLERPWILFEAGVAKGRKKTPVHGLMLGVKEASGPFAQFQNCDGSEAAMTKLVRQLCGRVPGFEPADDAVKAHVQAFTAKVATILKARGAASGRRWSRRIPVWDNVSETVRQQIDDRLDCMRSEVRQLLDERGKQVTLERVRANLMLPDSRFRERTQFPGQLCFVLSRPEGSYGKQELSNRFAPGEGVSGKAFLDGLAFAEDGKFGVSQKKLKVMPNRLSAVAGFPLFDPDLQYAFGVVCVDLLDAAEVDADDLRQLIEYEPVLNPVREISRILNPRENASFELEFAARF